MPSKKYYDRFKAKKQCLECSQRAVQNHLYCQKHLEKMRQKSVLYRKKYKEQNRCERCGYPLWPDMDDHCVSCINCREEVFVLTH